MILAINWSVDSELIDGWKTPNLYGLLFVTGLVLGYFVIRRMFRREGIADAILDKLVLYMVLATIIGARLGHVLFYGPYWDGPNGETGYFSHPEEIFKIWEGGLASHGGIGAIVFALWLFSRRVSKRPVLWIMDRMTAAGAIGGCFIRLGNLVNHEIVGNVTDVPWGFKFLYHDCAYPYTCPWEEIPARHPAQLYEALAYLLIFSIMIYMYWKRNAWRRPGLMLGTFFVLLFGARFLIEFVKIGQTARDDVFAINTGQMLSIPFILAGAFILWRALKKEPLEELPEVSTKKEKE